MTSICSAKHHNDGKDDDDCHKIMHCEPTTSFSSNSNTTTNNNNDDLSITMATTNNINTINTGSNQEHQQQQQQNLNQPTQKQQQQHQKRIFQLPSSSTARALMAARNARNTTTSPTSPGVNKKQPAAVNLTSSTASSTTAATPTMKVPTAKVISSKRSTIRNSISSYASLLMYDSLAPANEQNGSIPELDPLEAETIRRAYGTVRPNLGAEGETNLVTVVTNEDSPHISINVAHGADDGSNNANNANDARVRSDSIRLRNGGRTTSTSGGNNNDIEMQPSSEPRMSISHHNSVGHHSIHVRSYSIRPNTAAFDDAAALSPVPLLPIGCQEGVYPAWGVGLKELELEGKPDGDGRETWTKGLDYLIATIGFAVDLATVWRFPYLCYKNGGGAFLIPYFVMLLFGGLPLFFMEVVLGQFHRAGPAAIWKIVPCFKGVGYCVCFIAFAVSFYYNVILGWSVFYIWSSLTLKLPWTSCENAWNTPLCFTTSNQNPNITYAPGNNTLAAYEFFELKVLEIQGHNFENIGPPKWDLLLSTMSIFLILYFSLWQGVKSSGKVVWFTALSPYVILLILLIRGFFLPGSIKGILYFIIPTWDRLFTAEVWIEAAVQVFFSVGAGFGVHLAFASYNRFNHDCYRDCMITIIVNCLTSVFSGVVVFAYLGFMAQALNVDINEVAKDGPGLVFIVYPEALGTLPGSFVWAVIFFIMLFTLGIDSSMGGMESVLTGLKDEMPFISRHVYGREIFTLIVIGSSFLISIANVTHGGIYIFSLMDRYCASTNLLFATFCEAIAVGWFYGLEQMEKDMNYMLGFKPGIFWRVCWKFISPGLLLLTIVFSFMEVPPLEYVSDVFGVYVYPWWAILVGWSFAIIPMLLVLVVVTYKFCIYGGSVKQRFALLISPEWEHEAIRNNQPVTRFTRAHWFRL